MLLFDSRYQLVTYHNRWQKSGVTGGTHQDWGKWYSACNRLCRQKNKKSIPVLVPTTKTPKTSFMLETRYTFADFVTRSLLTWGAPCKRRRHNHFFRCGFGHRHPRKKINRGIRLKLYYTTTTTTTTTNTRDYYCFDLVI